MLVSNHIQIILKYRQFVIPILALMFLGTSKVFSADSNAMVDTFTSPFVSEVPLSLNPITKMLVPESYALYAKFQQDYGQSHVALRVFMGFNQPFFVVFGERVDMTTAAFLFNLTLLDLNTSREAYVLKGSANVVDVVAYELGAPEVALISKLLPGEQLLKEAKAKGQKVRLSSAVWELLTSMKIKLVLARSANLEGFPKDSKDFYTQKIKDFEFKYFGLVEYISKLPGVEDHFEPGVTVTDAFSLKYFSIVAGKVIGAENTCFGYLISNTEYFKDLIKTH